MAGLDQTGSGHDSRRSGAIMTAVVRTTVQGWGSRANTAWDRLKVNRNWLSFWFMLPAAAFLILFLAYPLGLGVWLSFTDAKIGRSGVFIGVENYEWLWDDSV